MAGWPDLEEPTAEEMSRVLAGAFSIDEEESEIFRQVFGNPIGQQALKLLHRRFIDQARFDPDHPNPVYNGFVNEGAARVVRMMEIKSMPEQEPEKE